MANSTTFTQTTTWIAPPNVISVQVEAWGGGGPGRNGASGSRGGSGGNGGDYAKTVSIPVTPGTSYTVTVGIRNSTGSAAGIDSSFTGDGGNKVLAKGGNSVSSSVGTTIHAGGSGGTVGVNVAGGGGGGGSGGTAAVGNNGSNSVGGGGGAGAAAVTGGGGGGAGANVNGSLDGVDGSAPGGGGGGASDTTDGFVNGAGARGQVILTWSISEPPTFVYNGGVVLAYGQAYVL